MNLGGKGESLIKKYEQFRNHPYIDAVGIPTIGWGNTFYEDGSKVTMNDEPLTRDRGNKLHENILKKFEKVVEKMVKVELNQEQFDALVSFVYNVGSGNFKASTLLRKINKDPFDKDISNQFRRWDKGTVNGRKKVLRGLSKRRKEEAELYFSGGQEAGINIDEINSGCE